ncbi:hypothetical protein [Enterovibrio norvegicus]|uniref:hypothetical protein n=1 Tax=Enterovibrio norvegicus TaxID=188144 RepID=UPI000C827CE2|nr:hypothetical protein [Enterovibrio norvegicus]PMH60725.1 hypothetical protein BCU62_21510 [Enterovibrio norvegicus]
MKTNLLQEFLDNFRKSFDKDILDLFSRLKEDSKIKQIEALCIYSAGGFRSIGYALRQDEDLSSNKNNSLDAELLALLEGHSDLEQMFCSPTSDNSTLYSQVCADEWSNINDINCFSDTNALVDSSLDQLYDAGVGQQTIQTEILNIIVSSFDSMISKGFVSKPLFVSDPFLSVQFSGSTNTNILLESSKRLNNPSWHQKVEQFIKENS